VPKKQQEMREVMYDMVIKVGMLEDYEIPNDFHVGDDLPDCQPPQSEWAWNCLNYRVSSVNRPFIFIRRKKDNALLK